MKDFHTFTKIAQKCGRFGQNYCWQMLKKVAQCGLIAQSGHTASHYFWAAGEQQQQQRWKTHFDESDHLIVVYFGHKERRNGCVATPPFQRLAVWIQAKDHLSSGCDSVSKRSFLTPEVHGSNPLSEKFIVYIVYCQLFEKTKIKTKRGRYGHLKKIFWEGEKKLTN